MNKICPLCGGVAVLSGKNFLNEDVYECTVCHEPGHHSRFKEKTVFDKITESVEKLAGKLVYYASVKIGRETRLGWLSTITGDRFYYLREEAIAATVAELKKEWKER